MEFSEVIEIEGRLVGIGLDQEIRLGAVNDNGIQRFFLVFERKGDAIEPDLAIELSKDGLQWLRNMSEEALVHLF